MSEHAIIADAASAVQHSGETEVSTPEFDRQEINSFGRDDGHAVTVIGKMLVGFFFYSLLVMAVVAWLTWRGVGQPDAHPTAAHHNEELDDF